MTTQYIVQYGTAGFVGPFHCLSSMSFDRGDDVLIRSPRGLELGNVLGIVRPGVSSNLHQSTGGELVRGANIFDHADAKRNRRLGQQILEEFESAAPGVAVIDWEVTLDAKLVTLHIVPWQEVDLDLVLHELSERHQRAVKVLDIRQSPTLKDKPEPKSSCGSGGCGSKEGGCSSGGCGTSSSGGGCSTGGCSRKDVKSADDLTEYFGHLRQQMEQAGMVRVPLN